MVGKMCTIDFTENNVGHVRVFILHNKSIYPSCLVCQLIDCLLLTLTVSLWLYQYILTSFFSIAVLKTILVYIMPCACRGHVNLINY